MESVTLRKFDMSKLADNSVIILIGKRRSGKSFLIKDILYHKRDFTSGIVISQTDHISKPRFFGSFIPPLLIYKEYSSKLLQNLYKRQEKADLEKWKDRRIFLVMDDCISDSKQWKRDKPIQQLFYEGRHFDIFYVLSTQDPMAIPPALRNNIDYTFIHSTNNKKMLAQIYENYAGVFESLSQFRYILEQCTEDNRVMVIDNITKSKKLEDIVFYYKASPHDDLKLFSQDIWDQSDRVYNREATRQQDGNTLVIKRR